MRVSSRSRTKVYVCCLASPSRAGRNGGYTLGRLVKLFGNLAVVVLAIADALRIANGFLPVNEFPPWPLPEPPDTRLLVPLVLVELVMPLEAGELLDYYDPIAPPFTPTVSIPLL